MSLVVAQCENHTDICIFTTRISIQALGKSCKERQLSQQQQQQARLSHVNCRQLLPCCLSHQECRRRQVTSFSFSYWCPKNKPSCLRLGFSSVHDGWEATRTLVIINFESITIVLGAHQSNAVRHNDRLCCHFIFFFTLPATVNRCNHVLYCYCVLIHSIKWCELNLNVIELITH